jgi:hypothetical protein
VNEETIEMTADLNYDERLVQVLEYGQKELRQKTIPLVKVLWSHRPIEEATWETKLEMRQLYPKLFEVQLNFKDEIFVRKGDCHIRNFGPGRRNVIEGMIGINRNLELVCLLIIELYEFYMN